MNPFGQWNDGREKGSRSHTTATAEPFSPTVKAICCRSTIMALLALNVRQHRIVSQYAELHGHERLLGGTSKNNTDQSVGLIWWRAHAYLTPEEPP